MKKTFIVLIAALVIAACVLTAGCTTTTSSSESTVVTDADGNVLSSTGSGFFKISTDKGDFTVSVNEKDPVVGGWHDAADGLVYRLINNSSALLYTCDENGNLRNPEERRWGKIEGKTDAYLVDNPNGENYVIFIYSAADNTLTNEAGNQVFTRAEVTWFD
ncbi:MAG TPA: hypothetical protein O0X97_05230 [Methanocorpusculum sp.]|nr:hypothetical protein [Methanocorpusculum sp.]